MSGNSKRYSAQRERWWHEDPHCRWCGRLTILWAYKVHATMPDNAATVDHLDSRFSNERGAHSGKTRRLLACYRCNQSRCDADLAVNLELQREKSGAYPLSDERRIKMGAD